MGVGPGLYLQAGQHWSSMGLQGLRCQWPGLAGPCHRLWRLGGKGDLRCPVTQFLDVHPCEDWTCLAHWVEQAWEPVSSGKRLPCLPASSKLWLGFLADGSGVVCVRRSRGVASLPDGEDVGESSAPWRREQIVPLRPNTLGKGPS